MEGNVIFACGKKYSNVEINKAEVGMRICVFSTENPPQKLEQKDKTNPISCFGCPCKRKAKRQEKEFFHEKDKKIGKYITCCISKIEKNS